MQSNPQLPNPFQSGQTLSAKALEDLRRAVAWAIGKTVKEGPGIFLEERNGRVILSTGRQRRGQSPPPHPFKTTTAAPDAVSVAPGLVTGQILRSIAYNPDPLGEGTFTVDGNKVGMWEFPETAFTALDLESTYCVHIRVTYQEIRRTAGESGLTIAIEEPGNETLQLWQWIPENVFLEIRKATVTRTAEGKITAIALTTAGAGVSYPVSVITLDDAGITGIEQIVRSDFREPLGGTTELGYA